MRLNTGLRKLWLLALVCGVTASQAWGADLSKVEKLDPQAGKVDEAAKVTWYDIRLLGVEGQGWTETKAPFDRLPARAEGKVRDAVWNLSRDSAGLCVRFVTSSPTIQARWTLNKANLAMTHMPATGVSGVDLYVKDEGKWKWLAIGQPKAQTNSVTLASGIPAGTREYLLYLPLYNGVSSVEVGVPTGMTLAKGPAYDAAHAKPILFYGTSITQGGCASRPGMVHTSIIGRRLQRPVINMGFSGNGRMEADVGGFLSELDPAVYVIDCLPNMGAADVTARTEPLVLQLRKAHPTTPILLVEDRSYGNSFLIPGSKDRNTTNRAALKAAYQKMVAEGVKNLFYLEGEKLLTDNEGTVDSSHPTDLGFVQHADAFEAALKPLLSSAK